MAWGKQEKLWDNIKVVNKLNFWSFQRSVGKSLTTVSPEKKKERKNAWYAMFAYFSDADTHHGQPEATSWHCCMCIGRAVRSRLQRPPWPSLSTFLTELITLKGPAQRLPPLSRTSKKQSSLFLSLLQKKKEQELTETGDTHILHLSGRQHLAWSHGLNPSVRTLLSPPSCSLALHSLESNRKKAPDGGYIKEKQQKVWEVQTSPSRSQIPSAFPTIHPPPCHCGVPRQLLHLQHHSVIQAKKKKERKKRDVRG